MATRGRENPQMRDHKEPMARTVEQERSLSEAKVSRGGINQESEHNKHNDPGQRGHAPQKMKPDQEGG
jgi:hypothetical protein